MNNTQIAHIIVKALNSNSVYPIYKLNSKNKNQLIAVRYSMKFKEMEDNNSSFTWKGSPIHLTRIIQILKPLLDNPAKAFITHEDPTVNITLKYYLEHGS